MGVYVFESLHAPYLKVGHHLVTKTRPNAYYRVAGRGFQSCVHPPELDGLLFEKDLLLKAWYPSLTRKEEKEVHSTFSSGKIGEFHDKEDEDAILLLLDGRGERREVSQRSKQRALRWGFRMARRGKKKKKKRTV